uniref:Uncharacterized protein n=1 Tax=Timema tahoe TaxID=61484 RepID=A0A7R9IQR5_9NEOP|nr:unnamed protein product [Timema tahoe]
MTSPDLAGANYRPLYVVSQSSGEDLNIKTPNPLDRAVYPIIDLHAEFPRDGETSTCPRTSPANWKVSSAQRTEGGAKRLENGEPDRWEPWSLAVSMKLIQYTAHVF